MNISELNMIAKYIYSSGRLTHLSKNFLPIRKCMSTFNKDFQEEAAVVSEDGKILVFWHPEPQFPYECTKPIPEKEVDASHLKLKYNPTNSVFNKMHPYYEVKMLQKLTFTNKHIWFPREERKFVKFKEQEPRDREYL